MYEPDGKLRGGTEPNGKPGGWIPPILQLAIPELVVACELTCVISLLTQGSDVELFSVVKGVQGRTVSGPTGWTTKIASVYSKL